MRGGGGGRAGLVADRPLDGAERRRGASAKRFLNENFIPAVFPRGPKKRKSNNDDKHGDGQEKRRPTTLS